MSFDRNKLTEKDLLDLGEAVKRTAPKTRFWYSLPNTFCIRIDVVDNSYFSFINEGSIIKQTGATSDYDACKKERSAWWKQDEYNSRKVRIEQETYGFRLKNLLGIKDITIGVYNPTNPLPRIRAGLRHAKLTQINGINFGNIFKGGVDIERGTAYLNEDDQDLAHRLGLMYTPSGIVGVNSLTSSDVEMHNAKPRLDESGNPIIYCDNRYCRRQIRNPVLVVEPKTGGAYHSHACWGKDIKVKAYLGLKGFEAKEVSLEDAIEMYQSRELQQSPNTKKPTEKYRSLNTLPEVALMISI